MQVAARITLQKYSLGNAEEDLNRLQKLDIGTK